LLLVGEFDDRSQLCALHSMLAGVVP
jgi:hypothetical protein